MPWHRSSSLLREPSRGVWFAGSSPTPAPAACNLSLRCATKAHSQPARTGTATTPERHCSSASGRRCALFAATSGGRRPWNHVAPCRKGLRPVPETIAWPGVSPKDYAPRTLTRGPAPALSRRSTDEWGPVFPGVPAIRRPQLASRRTEHSGHALPTGARPRKRPLYVGLFCMVGLPPDT